MKPIYLSKKERITADSRQFIYQEGAKLKDSDDLVWSNKMYCPTLSDLCKCILSKKIRMSEKEIGEAIIEARDFIKTVKKEIADSCTIRF